MASSGVILVTCTRFKITRQKETISALYCDVNNLTRYCFYRFVLLPIGLVHNLCRGSAGLGIILVTFTRFKITRQKEIISALYCDVNTLTRYCFYRLVLLPIGLVHNFCQGSPGLGVTFVTCTRLKSRGSSSIAFKLFPVVKVNDSWSACQNFELETAEDLPCTGAMHVQPVDSSKVLPLEWKLGEGGASSGVVLAT
ncbi:hypothetical protein TNCV_2031521 [Trichonephila clavipes]|nr:hypothetical protein TNCV_2031521 [Trichonephila clavipes]